MYESSSSATTRGDHSSVRLEAIALGETALCIQEPPATNECATLAATDRRLRFWRWVFRGLTFDMRGGRKWAKPACGRPLDGRVRRRCASDRIELSASAHTF